MAPKKKASRQDIESRSELYQYLEKKMQSSYEQLLDKGKVESGSSFVKSFLLECDWQSQSIDREQEKEYLSDLLSIQPEGQKKKQSSANIIETNEAGLYIVNWEWNEQQITLYLDTISDSSRRFWRAYSISTANYLDDILNRLINSKTYLDRTWLWSDLLERTHQKGESKGFRFEHDYSYFDTEQTTDPFSLKASGDRRLSDLVFQLMRNNDRELASQTSLGNIRMKYMGGSVNDEFAIETLYFNGKFTTNGTSFSSHNSLLEQIQRTYSDKVYQVESEYNISTVSNGENWYVEGEPIVFDLSQKKIQDIDTFCLVLFSGKMPFKLWGVPRETSTGEGRIISCVDLHNGAKIFFEIYPEIICMYLSAGACGNTAIRFYTNLQRTFSRLVDVQDDIGNQLF